MQSNLQDGEFIIAQQVGLPTPAEQFTQDYAFLSSDDHVWTRIARPESDADLANCLTPAPPSLTISMQELAKKLAGLEVVYAHAMAS